MFQKGAHLVLACISRNYSWITCLYYIAKDLNYFRIYFKIIFTYKEELFQENKCLLIILNCISFKIFKIISQIISIYKTSLWSKELLKSISSWVLLVQMEKWFKNCFVLFRGNTWKYSRLTLDFELRNNS